MPRTGRIKAPEYIYHIMCRSISELALFRDDDDKACYLGLIKKYINKFKCKVYAYCLMNNHLHMHVDPQGFDISSFMHCLNLSYVIYYNRKYKRHGHVFQGRYESRVVASDQYNLAVSAYIHNNAKDIENYAGREHEYPFSSYGIYLGLRRDTYEIIDTSFVLGLINAPTAEKALQSYVKFVTRHRDSGTVKSIMDCIKRTAINVYRDERKVVFRNIEPQWVVAYIAGRMGIPSQSFLKLKCIKEAVTFRAFCVFVMRVLCSYNYRQICESVGNISLSGISRLCSEGFTLYMKRLEYRSIFEDITSLA